MNGPAKRAYDASFGKIRRDLASLRVEISNLISGLDARQAGFNAELAERFATLSARVEELDKDVRTIAAGRLEHEAITRRLATLEDHLIEEPPAGLVHPAEPPDASASG